ncbi:ADP-forming succinate--CoA ligase subunit beta [bacterium]|nr:ADP-forming succinate--CoA ligase subunit beta [bacterium]
MNVHEFQAKEVFRRFGIPVPDGAVAETADQAERVAASLKVSPIVVKAQIHAGGRGKGRFKEHGPQGPGGVVLAKDPKEARAIAEKMLGKTLVTKQTGEHGRVVKKVYLTAGCDIARELYVAVVLDRKIKKPVVMVSQAGGVDIEEVAEKTPEKILKEAVDPLFSLAGFQARRLALFLGLKPGEQANEGAKLLKALVRAYMETDASLAEINPMIVSKDGKVMALDAKMNFDDNALERHPEILAYRDKNEEEPAETLAKELDLSYIALDGDIGCMVNGAGLAMATMDMIKYAGGAPANFLDVGGGATEQKVTEAFKIILSSPQVKAVLVNIFGGIMRCDVVAAGVIAAAKKLGLKVPVVVRLEGAKVQEGKKLLEESGLELEFASGLAEAAQKVVAASRGGK